MDLRISTTTVETYRRYRTADYVSTADMDAAIRGDFKPTREVQLGMALDKILERPALYLKPGEPVRCEGITFPEDVVRQCVAAIDYSGISQAKACHMYALGPDVVTVVSKADRIAGTRGREFKTRWGAFDIDSYRASCQWRFYLDVFGADSWEYTVFVMSEYESGEIALRSIEQWTEYPYPELHADCEELLRGLVGYARDRRLLHHFGPKDYAQPLRERAAAAVDRYLDAQAAQ